MGVYVFSEAGPAALARRRPDRLRAACRAGDARRRGARLRLPLRRLLAGRRDDPVLLGGGSLSWAEPELDLYDRTGSSTPAPRSAPAKIGPTAQVHRKLVSHGCVINGTVVNSVLSPGVRVDVGAVVRDSIVMFDSVIGLGAVVDRSILDKEVVVGQGAIVGEGPYDDRPNKQEPGRLNTGITVVGKRAVIPRGVRIGRNVKVAGESRTTIDFVGRIVRTGASVERMVEPRRPVLRRGRPLPLQRRRSGQASGGSDRRLGPRPRRGGSAGREREGLVRSLGLDSGHVCSPTRSRRRSARPTSNSGSTSLASGRSSVPTATGSSPGTSCSTAAAGSICA